MSTAGTNWCTILTYSLAAIFHYAWSLLDTIRSGLTTLKILRFEVDVDVYRPTNREDDPLRELLEELNFLSMTENIIEAMHFSFMVSEDLVPGNEWVGLDFLLCRPSWSSLKAVSLTVCVSNDLLKGNYAHNFHCDRERKEPAQHQWKDLPSQHLPMLSSNKAIRFDFHLG